MKCHFCDNDSRSGLIFKVEHWCAVCEMLGSGRIYLCKNHRNSTINFDLRHQDYGGKYDLCPGCNQWRIDAAAKVVAVKSSHVGGHKLKQKMEYLETRYRHDDMDSAKWELCYNAHMRGANAILNFYCISHQESNGNYKYKSWTAKGDLAVVEPNK